MSLLDGLVSYYKLDETSGTTAYDSLGVNNGTNNGATINQAGKIDKAYSFDGSNDYINLGNSINLNGLSFSLSVWAANTQTSSSSFLFGQGTSSSNKGLHVGRRDTSAKFTFAFFNNDLDSSTNMATDGSWELWTATYDASTKSRKIYRNGVLDASDTATANYQGTGQFNLGAGYSSPQSYFKGEFDEVGIWNRALTGAEITELYNGGNGVTYPFFSGYTLNLTKKGMGSEGGIITLNPNKEHYDENEEVEISLSTTGIDYRFHKFEGDLTGSNNPETIIMDDDKNVDIYFQKRVKIMEGLVF